MTVAGSSKGKTIVGNMNVRRPTSNGSTGYRQNLKRTRGLNEMKTKMKTIDEELRDHQQTISYITKNHCPEVECNAVGMYQAFKKCYEMRSVKDCDQDDYIFQQMNDVYESKIKYYKNR